MARRGEDGIDDGLLMWTCWMIIIRVGQYSVLHALSDDRESNYIKQVEPTHRVFWTIMMATSKGINFQTKHYFSSFPPTSNKLPYVFPCILLLVLCRCIYSWTPFLPTSSLIDSGFHSIATYFVLSSAFKIHPYLVPPSDSVLPATYPRVAL